LICLTLSLTALAQGAATEIGTQVIPSTTTLKCNQNKADYNLVVVRAWLPTLPTAGANTSVNAIGIALAPTDKGEIKMFARYLFSSTDPAAQSKSIVRRDDDSGELKKSLMDFNADSLNNNVSTFLQDCEPHAEVAAAVSQVLAQSNPSVADMVNAFNARGLKLDPEAATSGQQSFEQPLTIDGGDQLMFARAMRALLEQQLKRTPSEKLSGPSNGDDLSATRAELEATKRSLEEAGKKVDSLSTLLSILLGVLATALFLCLILAVLSYFSPSGRRKILFFSEDPTEIRRQAINELYTGFRKISEPTKAQQKLEEILSSYRKRFDGAKGNLAQSRSAYCDFETEIRLFCLSLAVDEKPDVDQNSEEEINAVRQFLSDHFGLSAKKDVTEWLDELSCELNKNLLLIVGEDSKSSPRILPRLKTARQLVETMWLKHSSKPCPKGALAILEQEWGTFQSTLQPLKQIEPTETLAYAQEAVALFNHLRGKFLRQPQKPGELKPKVERFFKELETVQNTHLPALAQSNPTPENILTKLSAELDTNKQTITKFNNLNTQINDLRRELPSPDGASTDAITQAIRMAKQHRMALDLLQDYRPSNDRDDLTKTVKVIQNKIESVTSAVSTVLPQASGTIDVMVSSLVDEFNSKIELAKKAEEFRADAERLQSALSESQAQAKESAELAGTLSHYVNLSAEKEIDPSQVSDILQRFSAGENVHRQLRLRLSAAIPALDQAIEDARGAGRGDALDALRISDFKERLRGLLTNIEDYTGDAMWKDCLSSGFSQQWLHNLLRAELLAQTYFVEDEALARLVDTLAEASRALRATIRHFNVRVPFIRLLSKPPAGARVDYEVDPKLSKLPEVKRKVQAMLRAQGNFEDGLNFIVDVGSFPFQSASTEDFGGRVVVVSPAEWA
jgi:hypothetical protein